MSENKEIKILLSNLKLSKEIERLNKELLQVKEQYRNLFEENMRLRKEINLHSGKLVINDIEVKEVIKSETS